MGLDDFARNLATTKDFQVPIASKIKGQKKIVHMAEVIDNDDFANMGRIKTKIIDFDFDTGEVVPGKDKDEAEAQISYPLLAQFVNTMPRPGELVYIILENPKLSTSARFYIGPVRSAKLASSPLETASSANRIFNGASYNSQKNSNIPSNDKGTDIPKDYVYIKGKEDSDIIFKPREVLIRAGSLLPSSYLKNKSTPCYVQVVQKTAEIEVPPFAEKQRIKFSQTNIVGSNINLISSDSSSKQDRVLDEDGNIANENNVEIETNPKLEVYGEQAKKLHPLVLGDELVDLLKIIINFCLNHYHTPQRSVKGPTSNVEDLESFLEDLKISKILSKSVRTN